MQQKYAQYFSRRTLNHRLNDLCTTHDDRHIFNADKTQSTTLPGDRANKIMKQNIVFVRGPGQDRHGYIGQWRSIDLIMIKVAYRTVIEKKTPIEKSVDSILIYEDFSARIWYQQGMGI